MDKDINNTESIREQQVDFSDEIKARIIDDLKKVPKGRNGFLVIKGPNIGEKFFIGKDSISIGRSPESDIFLDDITVSRQHAFITSQKESLALEDAGSLNGSYVNGERVDSCLLKSGDRVQIGKYIFLYFTT
ncbi:MAG: FHA domain-containing protein [Actinomycetota bacterium]|nr:FHA domain-containing protein [Actinomycetota bacterium]